MTYTIKGSFATLNEHDKANRANRYVGAKLKKDMTEIAQVQFNGKEHIAKPCYISFDWYISNRSDPDNIRFAAKYILDGMVKAGILPNDNQTWILGFKGDSFTRVKKGQDKVVINISF